MPSTRASHALQLQASSLPHRLAALPTDVLLSVLNAIGMRDVVRTERACKSLLTLFRASLDEVVFPADPAAARGLNSFLRGPHPFGSVAPALLSRYPSVVYFDFSVLDEESVFQVLRAICMDNEFVLAPSLKRLKITPNYIDMMRGYCEVVRQISVLPALPQEINTLMAAANLPACTINVLDFQQSNKASYHKIEVITPGSTKLHVSWRVGGGGINEDDLAECFVNGDRDHYNGPQDDLEDFDPYDEDHPAYKSFQEYVSQIAKDTEAAFKAHMKKYPFDTMLIALEKEQRGKVTIEEKGTDYHEEPSGLYAFDEGYSTDSGEEGEHDDTN